MALCGAPAPRRYALTRTITRDQETSSRRCLGQTVQGVGTRLFRRRQPSSGAASTLVGPSLRALHNQKKKDPEDEGLRIWATQLKALSEEAIAWATFGPGPQWSARTTMPVSSSAGHGATRVSRRQRFLRPCANGWSGFCQRCSPVRPSPLVSAHHPVAERSVHPVMTRKISGGSCRPNGSATRMGLVSLPGTWMAPGLHLFQQRLALLSQPHALGHV